MPGSPPSASTARPESSASDGRPEPAAAAVALRRALSSKVVPVSSGSGRPSADAEATVIWNGATISSSSRSLPALWVAKTSLSPRLRRLTEVRLRSEHRELLQADQFADAGAGQSEKLLEFLVVERLALCGRLDFDEAARTGHDEVGVGVGLRIFGVVEIED